MSQPVTLLHPIYNPSTGALIASKGATGDVTGYVLPPGDPGSIPAQRQILFLVVFNVNNANIGVYLQNMTDFIFNAGDAGLLNIVTTGASIVSVVAKSPDGTDLQVQSAAPAQFPVGYTLRMSNGLAVLFVSDRNIGILRVELAAL